MVTEVFKRNMAEHVKKLNWPSLSNELSGKQVTVCVKVGWGL
jgi:hypothetical protein